MRTDEKMNKLDIIVKPAGLFPVISSAIALSSNKIHNINLHTNLFLRSLYNHYLIEISRHDKHILFGFINSTKEK